MVEAGPLPQQIEFLKKVVSGLLVEFTASSLHELLKCSDQSQVYQLFKNMDTGGIPDSPIFRMEHMAKKKGIEMAMGFLQIHESAYGNPDRIEGEIRERGAILTNYNCIFKDTLPEICLFSSHLGTEVLCQLADPELECLWTHHLASGDPFCRCIFKKNTTPYKDPDSLGKVVTKLPKVDLTDEWLAQYKNYMVTNYWAKNTFCFKKLHGPEKTIEILGANAKRIGKNFGSSLIEANMLPARDIAAIGSLIHQFGEGFAMQGKITSMAPGVFAKEITECPFKTAPPEVCKQWEAFFNGMLEEANPELMFRYDRMMTAGDKTCKWVIKKK